jgi:hypothetical protein
MIFKHYAMQLCEGVFLSPAREGGEWSNSPLVMALDGCEESMPLLGLKNMYQHNTSEFCNSYAVT